MAKRLVSVLLAAAALVLVVRCARQDRSQATAKSLLNKYGWSVVGDVKEGTAKLPSDFTFRTDRAPWHEWLDLSKGVGLDFSSQAGKTVGLLNWKVNGKKQPIPDDDLQAILIMDSQGHVVGGWLAPIQGDGLGYSLEGKTLEEVTGLTWGQYLEKYRADRSMTEPQEAHGVVDPPPDGTELPPASPTIGPDVPAGVVQLLEKDMKAYLDPFLSENQPDWDRLKDWRLESIIWDAEMDHYGVRYAVLPAVRQTNWWAGNGVAGKDGWIVHKVSTAKVVEQNGVYEVVPGGAP